MIVISFYTNNNPYPKHAQKLKESLNKHNLQYDIEELPVFPSWQCCNNYKPHYCLKKLLQHQQSVTWMDCDCQILRTPNFGGNKDFQIYNWYAGTNHLNKTPNPNATQLLCSGAVIHWNYTEPAITLLKQWISYLNNQVPTDQVLDYAHNVHRSAQGEWLTNEYLHPLVPSTSPIITTDWQPYENTEVREIRWKQDASKNNP